MKKITIAMVIALIAMGVCKAQEPLRWGVKTGINVSTEGGHANYSAGFHVGALVEYQFFNNILLLGELLLTRKGFDNTGFYSFTDPENGIIGGQEYDIRKRSYYLELPVHAGYSFEFTQSIALKLSAGPYIAVGLWGKTKDEDGDFRHTLYRHGKGDKRFDIGIGGKAMLEFSNHYQLSVGYDYGFIKTNNKDYFGDRNKNVTVSIAYIF